jgi:hypothetical protein
MVSVPDVARLPRLGVPGTGLIVVESRNMKSSDLVGHEVRNSARMKGWARVVTAPRVGDGATGLMNLMHLMNWYLREGEQERGLRA